MEQLSGRLAAPDPLEHRRVVGRFATGVTVLTGALAALECRTTLATDAGDHTVVVGEVLALSEPDPTADPLLYFGGRYRTLSET